MAWDQLELEDPHIAYACVGAFCVLFSLVSLFIKDRLYIGEATCAGIAGVIFGPHCLNWFDPILWGNTDYITLEICRLVLCIQIVAVAVELPKKYMLKHWLSVLILLLPVMTCGWLIVGAFIFLIIPGFNFTDGLLVAACVTATDPVLAAAVVGKGKFAERVPGHLRNLLTAESGCNDGMAFPFIFLSLNLILYKGQAGEIVKNWFCLTILWECMFGIVLGVAIGFLLRKLIYYSERWKLIDRQSFLAFFVFLAFICAGFGSILGIDDLLCSFAAGAAFGWNGEFARKTEESHVSTVIDLLLNLSFFVYFGAIVPWEQFNRSELGLDVWRLILIAIVIIFLRRIPAVLAMKPFTPDIKLWREALFCGHFGPIGVGAIFAAILARKDLEAHYTEEETPLYHLPKPDFPHYQLVANIWPIVCFIVVTLIIVHGSSVAVLALGKRLNRMAITMTFTQTNTQEGGSNWMDRLKNLESVATNFSLHRVDSLGMLIIDEKQGEEIQREPTVETLGVKVRPAGGAKRKRQHKKRKLKKRATEDHLALSRDPLRRPPEAETLQLGGRSNTRVQDDDKADSLSPMEATHEAGQLTSDEDRLFIDESMVAHDPVLERAISHHQTPAAAYAEGDQIIVEDRHGEVIDTIHRLRTQSPRALMSEVKRLKSQELELSVHLMDSLVKKMSRFLAAPLEGLVARPQSPLQRITLTAKKAFIERDDPKKRRLYAHQIDNLIIIENEDGEIIRRYRVNRQVPQVRKRGNTLMGRAKLALGFGAKGSGGDEEWTMGQPQDPAPFVSPEGALDDPANPRLEARLNQALKPRQEQAQPEADDEELSEDSEAEESDEGETEVERRRRLQALGKLPTKNRPDDEEV